MAQRVLRPALVTLLLLLPLSASAERVRVALLDVRPRNLPLAQVAGLNPLLARRLAELPEVELLTRSDLSAMVGGDTKKELLACDQASCMVETGLALGLRFVGVPEVAQVGGVYVVSIAFFDVRRTRPASRETRTLALEERLAAEAQAALEAAWGRARVPPTGGKKVAVLETRTSPGQRSAAGLDAVVAGALATHASFEVLAPADVEALVAIEQRAVLGCDQSLPSCLSEIGGALGVGLVVSTEVARSGGGYVFGLTVLDPARGEVTQRVVQRVAQEGNLVDAARAAAREAFLDVAPSAASVAPAFERASSEARVERAPYGSGFGWALTGSGVAAVGTGFGLIALAQTTGQESRDAAALDDKRRLETDAIRMNGLGLAVAAGGLVLTGFGVTFLLTDDDGVVEVSP